MRQYIFDTLEEAEKASNLYYLERNPEGTTELLYGILQNADGKFELAGFAEGDNPASLIMPSEPTIWELPLDEAKHKALTMLEDTYQAMLLEATGNPTAVERDTWTNKLPTAQAIIANEPLNAMQTAFCNGAGLVTHEAQTEWANAVIANATAYNYMVGIADNMRSHAKQAIHASTDKVGLNAVMTGVTKQVQAILEGV